MALVTRLGFSLALLLAACGTDGGSALDASCGACSLNDGSIDAAAASDAATKSDLGTMSCKGVPGGSCAAGTFCVDAPQDGCDPAAGDTDCEGQCIAESSPGCGGFIGMLCPNGSACVDDPRDLCAPPTGADCPGVCAPVLK